MVKIISLSNFVINFVVSHPKIVLITVTLVIALFVDPAAARKTPDDPCN